MKQPKIRFRFHDPNPPETAADVLLKLFLEVDGQKAEEAICRAAEQNAGSEENDAC